MGDQYQPTHALPPIAVSLDPPAIFCRECWTVWQADRDPYAPMCRHYDAWMAKQWADTIERFGRTCSQPGHVYGCGCHG